MSPNLVRCKTYILHHSIKDCHDNFLLKIQYILLWLLGNIVEFHELHKLELLWFRTITCKSRTHLDGEKALSLNSFSHGNQIKRQFSNLRSKLHLKNVHIVSRHNTTGGLALFWKNMIDLHIQDSLPLHIDAVVNLGVEDA